MNFRKASIFQRDTEKPEEQNDSGGMLAVWGSPGSGKTITAVKIAKMLSARKKNVILLLCDMAAPMLPCICPADALESNGSLAGVLAAARISENLIKHNLVTFKRNSCLAVLGLLERQNEYSTPPFTQKQVVELLDGLRQIAPYVIVDCGSYIANDILSAVALIPHRPPSTPHARSYRRWRNEQTDDGQLVRWHRWIPFGRDPQQHHAGVGIGDRSLSH